MPRVHFAALKASPQGMLETLLPRPAQVPDGYTPVMLVTEWLTLNCRGDWACRADSSGLRVRFTEGADQARAAARFMTPDVVVNLAGPVRQSRPRARAGQRAAVG